MRVFSYEDIEPVEDEFSRRINLDFVSDTLNADFLVGGTLKHSLKFCTDSILLLSGNNNVNRVFSGRKLVSFGVQGIKFKEIFFEGLQDTCDSLMFSAKNLDNLTIVISTTVLDSSFSNDGVVGGLTPRELIYFCQRIRNLRNYSKAHVFGDSKYFQKLLTELSKAL